jgi:outer membrane murein-binding lipoprotein Lpp
MGTHFLKLGFMLAVVTVAGCSSQPSVASRASQEQSLAAFKHQANQLYDAYLAGDRAQAKHSLEESIRLAEESNLPPTYQVGCLFFYYARLYVLERSGGSERQAEAALVKAHYWSVREAQLGGNSDAEAGARAKVETGDQIMAFIDKSGWLLDSSASRRLWF